jgi:hypothetical protein
VVFFAVKNKKNAKIRILSMAFGGRRKYGLFLALTFRQPGVAENK